MGQQPFSGTEKAAILLLTLGEDIASEIFSQLSEQEIRRVGAALNRLGPVDPDSVEQVAGEFQALLQNGGGRRGITGHQGPEFLDKVLKATGYEQWAEDIGIGKTPRLESAAEVEAAPLARFIKDEHPQTGALILAHLEPRHFAETVKHLPDNQRSDLLYRVAHLEPVEPEVLEDIDDVVRKTFRHNGGRETMPGGPEKIASMLNTLSKEAQDEFLDKLAEKDPDTARDVRERMFVFDDLESLDDRNLQTLIAKASGDTLRLALKGASESLKARFFENMSSRAGQMLRDDIESMGKKRRSEVEEAQRALVDLTKDLEEQGEIIIIPPHEQVS